jgi:hypothetical protein
LSRLQVVVAAHFVFRCTAGSSDGGNGALSSAGVSLVLSDVSMPAGGAKLVLDTQFSVSWVNSSAPATALQVSLTHAWWQLPSLQVHNKYTAAPVARHLRTKKPTAAAAAGRVCEQALAS